MLKTLSIIVTGKVQGVYFRQSSREKAVALGITGEVKNMPDDTVYIIATGTNDNLEQFIEWCKQGSARAIVKNIIIADLPLQSFSSFKIVH